MKYLLFSNNVYLSDGLQAARIEKNLQLKEVLEGTDEACVCVVDVDVEIASAPETQIEKKDGILARKFAKLHPQNGYILQDEKIDENIFQVMGIKADKVREIYSLIPSEKVSVFIPYALSLRNFLVNKNVELVGGLVFIDDLGDEKLITVFLGAKFSVTRIITTVDTENILPEIKRSQIGFSKKIEEFDSWKTDNLTVLTNSQQIASYLSSNRLNINIRYIDVNCPAIEGLRIHGDSENLVRFVLPEEIKTRKRKKELKEKIISIISSIVIITAGLGFFVLNKTKLSMSASEYNRLNQKHQLLEEKLASLDLKTYREDLKQHNFINYATPYLEILNVLPTSYEIYSFRYYQTDCWNLETYIFSKDGESFDEIPRINILKDAVINDYFIKDKPGKRIQVEL